MNLNIKPLVEMALTEDIGSGDLTTEITIPARVRARGVIMVKERGIIAGLEIAGLVFKMVKRREKIQFRARVKDGDRVQRGQVVAEVSGPARSILMAERTALNFLQRLSGIATLTAEFVDKVRPYKARIMDTRKTTPGWRVLEKYAVRVGGGCNHRRGLDDGVLIKDNHIQVRSYELRVMSEKKKRETAIIGELIKLAGKKAPPGMKIEVEVKNLREAKEAVPAGADIIMLDNMNIGPMKKAVQIVRTSIADRQPLVEASGGVNLHNVEEIAKTGVDLISVGALTHSAKGLDISLKIIERLSAPNQKQKKYLATDEHG